MRKTSRPARASRPEYFQNRNYICFCGGEDGFGVFGASLGGGVELFELGIADELLSLGEEVVDGADSVPY